MQPNFTPFSDWLICQYPRSSARKHIISDLALFFSWIDKPPSEVTLQDVGGYCCVESP